MKLNMICSIKFHQKIKNLRPKMWTFKVVFRFSQSHFPAVDKYQLMLYPEAQSSS